MTSHPRCVEISLSAVVPSVMNAAFSRERALSDEEGGVCAVGTAQGREGKEEEEERAALERVEAIADRFCEQVRGYFDVYCACNKKYGVCA